MKLCPLKYICPWFLPIFIPSLFCGNMTVLHFHLYFHTLIIIASVWHFEPTIENSKLHMLDAARTLKAACAQMKVSFIFLWESQHILHVCAEMHGCFFSFLSLLLCVDPLVRKNGTTVCYKKSGSKTRCKNRYDYKVDFVLSDYNH